MIARNHHRANAGLLARFDGKTRLWARRVDHRHEAEQRHVGFGVGRGRRLLGRDRQHPQAIACHPLLDILEPLAIGGRQRNFTAGQELTAAAGDDVFSGAFRVRHEVRCGAVQRGHAAAIRRERDFGDARLLVGQGGEVEPRLGCGDEERAFGGIAVDGPAAVSGDQPRI